MTTNNITSTITTTTTIMIIIMMIQTDHHILTKRHDPVLINEKKLVDSPIPADHREEIKESEKFDKYFDNARKLKMLWMMMITIIPTGAIGTVSKVMGKRQRKQIRGRIQAIQITTLLRSAWILRRVLKISGIWLLLTLRRVLEIWGDLLSLKRREKPSANAGVKKNPLKLY